MGRNLKTDFSARVSLKTRTLNSQCENQTKNQTETGKNHNFFIFWLILNIIDISSLDKSGSLNVG
jgi:hypothetical protein